jgi:hypothetical protein
MPPIVTTSFEAAIGYSIHSRLLNAQPEDAHSPLSDIQVLQSLITGNGYEQRKLYFNQETRELMDRFRAMPITELSFETPTLKNAH